MSAPAVEQLIVPPYAIGSRAEHITYGAVTVQEHTASGVRVKFDVAPEDLGGDTEDFVNAGDLRDLSPYSAEEGAKIISDHISLLFLPDDQICISFIHSARKNEDGSALTENYCFPARRACEKKLIEKLQLRNAEGWNCYVASNSLQPGAKKRRKELAGDYRNLFIEIDDDGETNLAKIRASVSVGEIPAPSVILRSSAGKYQVLWRILSDGVTWEKLEAMNTGLSTRLGGDLACTDRLRLLRLPGLRNWKYSTRPTVEVVSVCPGPRYNFADFNISIIEEKNDAPARIDADKAELIAAQEYFEDAVEEANIRISPLRKWGESGWLWSLTCPWCASDHSNQKDSGTVVLLHRSAALDFKCSHNHCKDRRWATFRQKLEELVGHPLRFGEPVVNVILNTEPSTSIQIPVDAPATDSADFTSPFEHTLTPEEYESELDKEFPVIPLVEQAGPSWSDDIFYGPAGEIIKKASAYNEAHPAGMLLDFLVSFGNIVGRGPYFNISQTKHYTNEFLARVGDSSYSRKGGGRDAVDSFLQSADMEWYYNRVLSGFGSAEAIIAQMRDATEQSRLNRKTNAFTMVKVPGVTDKRLCIREGELASVFVLASKPDSRADVVLRDGWDSKPLRNVVKGVSSDGISNSAVCLEPHLSLSADTTRSEIVRKMPEGADQNGFANRFLYCYAYRTKLCPNGGPALDWGQEAAQFYEIIRFAKVQKCIGLSPSAKKAWMRMYLEIENNKVPGAAGNMTSRAAAHIRRLALIYTLIDKSSVTEAKHLYAARKLWDYCSESAEYIFNRYTKDQLQILHFVEARGTLNLSDIREGLFQRHKLAGWIKAQVDELVRSGYLKRSNEVVTFIKK